MRDVEEPNLIPNALMFCNDTLVLYRHLPTGKRNESRPEGKVDLVKGGTLHL